MTNEYSVKADKEFFKNNRIEMLSKIPEKIALVFCAGDEVAQSADCNNRFLVDRNFYYLTGIVDPRVKLLLIKNEDSIKTSLYVLPKDDMKERWQGRRRTTEEYSELTGIDAADIKDLEHFDEDLYEVLKDSTLKIGYDGSSIMSATKDFYNTALKTRIADEVIDIKDVLTRMRMVKKPFEIECIKAATKLTEDAIEDALEVVKPGSTEYDLFVRLDYEMSRRGSLIPAFETIVAVDDNSFYLHHNNPDDKEMKLGDIIQLDLGARINGYCADISRCIFVGRSNREEDALKMERRDKLHELIVKLRKEAYAFIKPGETWATLNNHMKLITKEWLIAQGLIQMSSETNTNDVKIVAEYYWHNTGHHLGLDVHDISNRELPFEAGNALAIEPGVYIKEWGLGFRIEDDVLVTTSGCELLSSGRDDMEVFLSDS